MAKKNKKYTLIDYEVLHKGKAYEVTAFYSTDTVVLICHKDSPETILDTLAEALGSPTDNLILEVDNDAFYLFDKNNMQPVGELRVVE